MITVTYVVAGAIMLFLGLVFKYLLPWINLKLGAEKLAEIAYWVGVLVRAAEQTIKGSGAEKLRWVEEQLAARGFALDGEAIRALIEAQVRTLRLEAIEGIEGAPLKPEG
jgi:hypothetical protein